MDRTIIGGTRYGTMLEADPTTGDRVFVVTYTPLVTSRHGREASERHELPPFIDGSIRREPDLEHQYPSISCLCRAGKFVPRLAEGDRVAYLARRGRYGQEPLRHWRLTAVLRVIAVFATHAKAAAWYRARSLPLPSNCMVPGNEAVPLERSHRMTPYTGCTAGARLHRLWDAAYRRRARDWPAMVACEPLYRELSWQAPVVHRDHLVGAFGRVPGTQNPTAFPAVELSRLMRQLGISAQPSSQ